MSDPVRAEAERLVAAAIGAFSAAARNAGGFATGSAECCVCPVCRLIASMRDPSPETAERLASGAGDLAVAVAGLLRTFGSARTADAGHDDEGDPWRAATNPPPAAPEPAAAAAPPPARKVAKKATRPGSAGVAEGTVKPRPPEEPE